MQVAEHTIELAGAPVFYRSAEAELAPLLYLHGCPTSSDDWIELLQRTGGIAPDLVGFGRSAKAANLDYTLAGLANFIELFLDHLEIQRVTLVAHDWGAGGGLVLAQRQPERVRRLVLVNALPLLDGFRWHGVGRIWRTPGLGEMAMGASTRSVLRRTLRRGYADPAALSRARFEAIWAQFDQGTQRAVLRLHRSSPERRLAEAGAALDTLAMPAVVIWGKRDPWFAPAFAERYGQRLQRAEVWPVDDAGHWPWLERQAVADRIEEFVRGA
ncbi:MAG: alpha/beta hydrolase [Solirubrobacterales bacterium]|nr:alpha/beta hydrolase [Solirubrobacterales bacterium]MBV9534539.1 alpha/beta hydrolase [Solirubrobacterales bacterium]